MTSCISYQYQAYFQTEILRQQPVKVPAAENDNDNNNNNNEENNDNRNNSNNYDKNDNADDDTDDGGDNYIFSGCKFLINCSRAESLIRNQVEPEQKV